MTCKPRKPKWSNHLTAQCIVILLLSLLYFINCECAIAEGMRGCGVLVVVENRRITTVSYPHQTCVYEVCVCVCSLSRVGMFNFELLSLFCVLWLYTGCFFCCVCVLCLLSVDDDRRYTIYTTHTQTYRHLILCFYNID